MKLAEHTSPATAEAVRALCARLEGLGLLPVWRESSLSLRLPDPDEAGNLFTIVVFRKMGTFFLGWLDRVVEKYGQDPVNRYLEAVVELTGRSGPRRWAGRRNIRLGLSLRSLRSSFGLWVNSSTT